MFRHGFFLRFVLILVIVGLLAAGGSALYRLGWAQGYQAGAVTAAPATGQSGSQAVPPAPFYGYGPWFYGPHWFGPGFGFFPFFPLFGIGFFLLLIFLISGLVRAFTFRRWAGGPGPYHWTEEDWRAWRERGRDRAPEREDRPAEPGEEKPKV